MKRSPRKNGTGNGLQAAIERLLNSQTALAEAQAMLIKDMAQINRHMVIIEEYLNKHEQALSRLPEAIRKEIGFVQGKQS